MQQRRQKQHVLLIQKKLLTTSYGNRKLYKVKSRNNFGNKNCNSVCGEA